LHVPSEREAIGEVFPRDKRADPLSRALPEGALRVDGKRSEREEKPFRRASPLEPASAPSSKRERRAVR
jgi:hypothetical protein